MFVIEAIIILVLPFVANVGEGGDDAHGDIDNGGLRFWGCFSLLFIFGAVNGMCQASVFGLAGILPGEYMGAVMFGNGVSGVATNSLGMLFLAIMPDK